MSHVFAQEPTILKWLSCSARLATCGLLDTKTSAAASNYMVDVGGGAGAKAGDCG